MPRLSERKEILEEVDGCFIAKKEDVKLSPPSSVADNTTEEHMQCLEATCTKLRRDMDTLFQLERAFEQRAQNDKNTWIHQLEATSAKLQSEVRTDCTQLLESGSATSTEAMRVYRTQIDQQVLMAQDAAKTIGLRMDALERRLDPVMQFEARLAALELRTHESEERAKRAEHALDRVHEDYTKKIQGLHQSHHEYNTKFQDFENRVQEIYLCATTATETLQAIARSLEKTFLDSTTQEKRITTSLPPDEGGYGNNTIADLLRKAFTQLETRLHEVERTASTSTLALAERIETNHLECIALDTKFETECCTARDQNQERYHALQSKLDDASRRLTTEQLALKKNQEDTVHDLRSRIENSTETNKNLIKSSLEPSYEQLTEMEETLISMKRHFNQRLTALDHNKASRDEIATKEDASKLERTKAPLNEVERVSSSIDSVLLNMKSISTRLQLVESYSERSNETGDKLDALVLELRRRQSQTDLTRGRRQTLRSINPTEDYKRPRPERSIEVEPTPSPEEEESVSKNVRSLTSDKINHLSSMTDTVITEDSSHFDSSAITAEKRKHRVKKKASTSKKAHFMQDSTATPPVALHTLRTQWDFPRKKAPRPSQLSSALCSTNSEISSSSSLWDQRRKEGLHS